MNEAHQLPSALALLAIQILMRETAFQFYSKAREDNRLLDEILRWVSLAQTHTDTLTHSQRMSKHLLRIIIQSPIVFEGC